MIKKIAGSVLIDLDTYTLPADKSGKTTASQQIYPALPRNTDGVDFDIYDYNMLFNDEPTKKIIREGETIGCFYIESPGMRSLLKRLSVDTFEMLTAASSIIRPGVAESGMMQEFILRHKDPKRRTYLIPEMKEYLSETYGIMIYQEDVLRVAHHIVGLSLEDADFLRRAMSGKQRSRKGMEEFTDKFYASCRKKGFKEEVIRELWRQIESFAGYAFCKAHSASFALLSFQVAYLKVHYPAEFMSSVLSNQGGYYSPWVYVQESKRIGLEVLPPCINNSEYQYTGSGKIIRIGLMAIKNLSHNTIDRIVSEREADGQFESLADFIARTATGYEESVLLIRCGAMDCFNKTRPSLMRMLDVYVKHRHILDESYNDLFIGEAFKLEKEIMTDVQYSIEEICAIEYETFGYMLSKHPLEFFDNTINDAAVIKARDMARYHGRKVKMAGWYMTSKRIKTKKGDVMKFLSLEDLTGTFEAVLFPKTYMQYAESTLSMGPYLVEGVVDRENGNNLIVNKLEVLSSEKIRSSIQKDSAENKYYGDVEKVTEEEMMMFNSLDKEKLKYAYI